MEPSCLQPELKGKISSLWPCPPVHPVPMPCTLFSLQRPLSLFLWFLFFLNSWGWDGGGGEENVFSLHFNKYEFAEKLQNAIFKWDGAAGVTVVLQSRESRLSGTLCQVAVQKRTNWHMLFSLQAFFFSNQLFSSQGCSQCPPPSFNFSLPTELLAVLSESRRMNSVT